MILTNILFCYWLQGFFEISENAKLLKWHIPLIENQLSQINEILWDDLKWLQEVCQYFKTLHYKQATLDYFLPLIRQRLNARFFHYIDNDKNIEYSLEELERLHAGLI